MAVWDFLRRGKQKPKNRPSKAAVVGGHSLKHLTLAETNLTNLYAPREERLHRSKWGAAQSYIIISYVEKCVELIASGMASLPLEIRRFSDKPNEQGEWEGDIVAQGNDIRARHPLFQLINEYDRRKNSNLIFRIALSLTLYDANFLELVRLHEKYPVDPRHNPLVGLDWLNPLGMELVDVSGGISGFTYSPYDNSMPAMYEPHEVAYTHGFNPTDDLRGYPDIMAALESLNIDDAIQRSVVAHFRNGIQASAAVSQKDALSSAGVGSSILSGNREAMENTKMRSRGVEQVGNFFFVPTGYDVTPLDYPRYDQITAFSNDTKKRILDQFGVPEAVVGNSDIAGYKQGDEVTYRFYVTNIIPRMGQLIRYLNIQIMPLLGEQYRNDRLEMDSSEFDRVSDNEIKEAQIVREDFASGLITYNQALKRRGYAELEDGDYLVISAGTTLVPPDQLSSLKLIETGSESQDDLTDPPTPEPGEGEPQPEEETAGQEETFPVKRLEFTEENMHRELDHWYTVFRRRGIKRAATEFIPEYTRGSIADWLAEALGSYDSDGNRTVKSYFREAKLRSSFKAIQATRLDFENRFVDITNAFISGEIDRGQWSRTLRSLIRKSSNKAFEDGLVDGGIEDPKLSDDERAQLNGHIVAQSQFVTALGDKIKKGEIKTSQVESKGTSWYNKSINPAYNMGIMSAASNEMVEWVLGPTEDHCRSCSGYNGQRHRRKTWMRVGAIPKSDQLDCHGDQCECTFAAVKGKARGRLKLISTKSFADLVMIDLESAGIYEDEIELVLEEVPA